MSFISANAYDQIFINSYTLWGGPGGTQTYNPNGDLNVTDTLIIYGNLWLDNDEDLIISSSGVVIVFGDFDAKNKVDLGLGGYFIVTGEFNKNGGQGDIIDNGGSMYIFDDTPQWGSPPAPPDDYGDEDDIINDPIFDFFNDLVQTVCNLSISSAVITNDLCNGNPPDGAIDITITGSVVAPPPIIYSWHDSESNTYTTQDISGLDTGVYRISVHQGFCFASDTFTIYSLSTAGAITGPATVCVNSSATYSITAIPGATSYVWSATNGATGSSNTNSIDISFPNSGSSIVSVYGVNSCGASSVSNLEVTATTESPAAFKINGTTQTCAEAVNQFSVTNNMNWTYIWTVQDNAGSIAAPANTAEVTITFENNALIFVSPFEAAANVTKTITATVTETACPTILQWEVMIYRLPEIGPTYRLANDYTE